MSRFTISSSYPVPSVMSRVEFEDIIKNLVPASDLVDTAHMQISGSSKVGLNLSTLKGDGLVVSGTTLQVEPLTSGGLTVASGGVSVNTDDTTIELSSGSLQVKASSITSAHIAPDTVVAADIDANAVGFSELNAGANLEDNGSGAVRVAQTMTGLTSVTSAAFVGPLTGNVTGDLTGNADTVTNGVYTSSKISALSATSSTELRGVISDETGTGSLVFATSPTLVTPALGTPASGTLTNCTFPTLNQDTTGTAATVTGATQAAITTAANLTTVGTISTGTWSGTTIAIASGGTGLTSVGTAGQILATNSGENGLEWVNNTPTLAALTDTTIASTPGTGSILYYDGPAATWKDTNEIRIDSSSLVGIGGDPENFPSATADSSTPGNTNAKLSVHGHMWLEHTLAFNDSARIDRMSGSNAGTSGWRDVFKGLVPYHTTLSAGITDTAGLPLTITVADSSVFPSGGTGSLQINGEQFTIQSTDNSTNEITLSHRAVGSSSAAAHSTGDLVTHATSNFGLLIDGYGGGHTAVAVRSNDINDAFSIVCSDLPHSGQSQNDTFKQVLRAGPTGVVLNEHGDSEYDFRVEGDTNENLLVCDASLDGVGIGGAAASGYNLIVHGTMKAAGTGGTELVVQDGTNMAVQVTDGTTGASQHIRSGAGDAVLSLETDITASSNDNSFRISNAGAETSFIVGDYDTAAGDSNPTVALKFNHSDAGIVMPALPTSAGSLASGTLFTQTAAELGGTGSTKVICIV